MATQVDMPMPEAVAAILVDRLGPGHEPILAADMSIPTVGVDTTADPLIPEQGFIPEGAVVTTGGVATTTVEKDTMADEVIMVATATMADVDIMVADMATLAWEVSIWGSIVRLTTVLAMPPTITVQATTVLPATTTNGGTGIQVPVIPIDQQYPRPKGHLC